MKVKIQQFLFGGTLYSWAMVGQNIGRSLLKLGHDVHFVSTDGVKDKYVPEDLKDHVQLKPENAYDMQISYTVPHNFGQYLGFGNSNRLGVWNYDGAPQLPLGQARHHAFCDKVCPSSNFSLQNFLNSGVPKEKLVVVPHGIDLEQFENKNEYSLKTNKKTKILLNIATPHLRKNIANTLKAYGEAFNKDDDVCLVIKVSTPKCSKSTVKQPPSPKGKKKKRPKKVKKQKLKKGQVRIKKPDFNFFQSLAEFKKEYPNHGEIEVISGFIPSMVELYNACDILFMMSHMEMWFLPGSEAMCSGNMIVVASNYGGPLHYLNDKNSLLIDGKIIRMPMEYQYWFDNQTKAGNLHAANMEMFDPYLNDAVEKLKFAVENKKELLDKFRLNMRETVEKFTWDNVAKQFEDMAV